MFERTGRLHENQITNFLAEKIAMSCTFAHKRKGKKRKKYNKNGVSSKENRY